MENNPLLGIDYDGRKKFKLPIKPASPFKICYRNLGPTGKCIRHSYLLIDGMPIGYGPEGVGTIKDDRDALEEGRANCVIIPNLAESQKKCLRNVYSTKKVNGNWDKRWWPIGTYCPSIHDCFDWTRAAFSTCGIRPGLVDDLNGGFGIRNGGCR